MGFISSDGGHDDHCLTFCVSHSHEYAHQIIFPKKIPMSLSCAFPMTLDTSHNIICSIFDNYEWHEPTSDAIQWFDLETLVVNGCMVQRKVGSQPHLCEGRYMHSLQVDDANSSSNALQFAVYSLLPHATANGLWIQYGFPQPISPLKVGQKYGTTLLHCDKPPSNWFNSSLIRVVRHLCNLTFDSTWNIKVCILASSFIANV